MRKLLYIIPILITMVLISRRDVIRIDGISGEIWPLILKSDTKYSKYYSHHKFAEIKIGMSEKQVLDILGEPLSRWNPYQYTMYKQKENFIGFTYSESPSDTNYRLRQIYLNNGMVAEIVSYYYLD